jgi:hypothetical protein
MGISPRVLTELFGSAGCPITERRLTDWRAKRWIPDVYRAERPAGTGRGAHYEWPDREIIAQVFTLLGVLELRGRMETASVLAWFSGFDVPRHDIRDLWVAFEALPWKNTLRSALAGEEGSVQDAVHILVTGERQKQRKKKDGYSDGFIDVMTRMGVDPAFDARTDLPSERVAKILAGDVPELVQHGAEMLSADVVRGVVVLGQDYWSAPRRIEVIQSIPDKMLAKAHADVRFLLSPYRAWLESSVSKMADGCVTDFEPLLWMAPRLAWRAGRFLMQLDIALRRLGYGDEVDTTIAKLRDLAAEDETRDVVSVFKQYWYALHPSDAPDLAEDASNALAQKFKGDPACDKAAEIFHSIGPALKNLWLPRLQLALAEAAMEGIENPAASTARHRNPLPTIGDGRSEGKVLRQNW